MSKPRIGILYSRVRVEEKLLFEAFEKRGVSLDLLDDQKLIFDKFRQAGDTLTAKPRGSGLGLHISRQIVEHFGGRMWVESAPGRGACFSFTLPT